MESTSGKDSLTSDNISNINNNSENNIIIIKKLKKYLAGACPTILEISSEQFTLILDDSEYSDVLNKFALSSEFNTLWIGVLSSNEVKISNEVKQNIPLLQSSLVIVKCHESSLDHQKAFSQQLQVITLSTDLINPGDDNLNSFLQPFKRYIQQIYLPLTKITSNDQSNDSALKENAISLQRSIRELDLAIDQCQRGTRIPSITLIVPTIINDVLKNKSSVEIKSYLEKYNPSQVDLLFNELGITSIMGNSIEDKEIFANEINKIAKLWPNEISRQTKLLELTFGDNIEYEINFWKDMEKKLLDTKDQLNSKSILLTKLILKRTNRISEHLINESEIELEKSIETTNISNQFLREFPLNDILNLTDLSSKFSKVIISSLTHFTKLKYSKFNYKRAEKLFESCYMMLYNRLTSIIREKNLLSCNINEFNETKHQIDQILNVWDEHYLLTRRSLQEISVRRNEKINITALNYHENLRNRLNNLAVFRVNHDKLLSTLSIVLSSNDADILNDIHNAYNSLLSNEHDIIDSSNQIYDKLILQYEKKIEKIEERIIKIVEDQLNSAKSAEEMFKIFSMFNPLFFRLSIRNAVNSFRISLVRNVKDDVKRLQEKFRLRYDDSLEKITADLKDIPPLSGRIIWARQIENQLTALMKRLENVIGDRWADHIEGKQLKQVCDELRNYLDTNTLYSEWLTQQLRSDNSRHNKTKDFLLLVEDDLKQNNQNNKLLRVNFDEKQVVIFKEVRYLEWLLPKMNTVHKSIPRTIKTISTEAYNRYPIAMALQAAIYSYNQTKQQINESNEMLLHSHIVNVRETIKEAFGGSKRMKRWVKWDSNNLSEWLTQLSNYVITLQESVLDVNEKLSTIKGLLSELEVTEYSKDNFENIIKQLQVIVDDMQMKGFSNIHVWVNQIDKKIEDILANRIESAIEVWINAFLYIENTKDVDEEDNVNENSYDLTSFSLDHVIHEILLSNQVLYVYPPIEHSRVEYINSLHQYLAVCTSLSRIVTSRYNVFAESIVKQKDFSNLLLNVNKDALMKPFKIVENKVSEAKAYIQSWLQYQVLWDTSSSMVSDKIGKDIQKWFQLLTEIKAARNNIDSDEEEKVFGLIIINHRTVQNKVNQKYDSWANDCQQKFSNILLDEIKEVYDDLKLSKSTLENIYLDGSTKDVIVGVEYILKMKAHLPVRKNQVNDLENSEKLLQKQRFLFPRDWVPVSNVIGLFTDFTSILNRRITAMESQLSSLQSKIKDEDVNINNNINNLISSWDKDKPEDGSLVPSDAITYLSTISSQINKLNDDLVRINKAKDALEIEYLSNDKLKDVSNELVDLKEVWIAISPIFDKIFSYKSTLLKDIQPIKLRKGLDELLDIIRHFPPKIRGYSIVEYQQEYINKLLSNQSIIRDLTSDTLKERHWKTIIQTMGLSKIKTVVFSEITLGLVYDSNPIQHKKFVSEVLSVAQGESALEQYLKDIRDFWVNFELNLIARENIRLISNWDILFTSLEDHLNSLSSLKQSPYYKNLPEFQEDTTIWETRLTSLRSIFEIWIEVQRKWIYLRGIFNNADIKAQLPSQYTKFKNIDSDVINLVKRVSSKPNVLDLLQIDNLNRLLDRYESTMSLIQKALGEYLEKQRQVFPRFYFVNNDDLIEIIGNSNEPIKIILHLNKMFAGINSLNLSTVSNSDKQELLGQSIISREGEVVDLVNKVNLTQPVKDWLMELENEMKNTLIVLLEGSFKDIPSENEKYLNYLSQYPSQIIILCNEISWTKNCESSFESNSLSNLSNSLETKLKQLSVNVLQDMNSDLRKKLEQLLTEMIHQRDVTRSLINSSISTKNDFGWVYHLRYYWLNNSAGDLLKRLSICMSNASFFYGFEYLGISERLVQTPLTERCYLTLTQALHFGMGGNPFGPAGTGKTESVKMLGNQLGRFVLVFNCDASFDYAAMGRIFAGLCQVGAWGCFDEFNRLEERILSAVSQQILTIQRGLMLKQDSIELLGNSCKLHKDVGIFVTLNPGYAGRSNLPDNLKQLFRAVAMAVPDRKLIAQVMLFSQGIVSAEELAGKIVLLFTLCEEQLSSQSHYDFGLRALKSVLVGAGDLKRLNINDNKLKNSSDDQDSDSFENIEKEVLIKSTCDSIVPKLVSEDIPLFKSLLQAVFPGTNLSLSAEKKLIETIKSISDEDCLDYSLEWSEKVLQLKQVLDMRHGIMMVGPSGSGKTMAWKTLFKALNKFENTKGEYFIIDPKAITKEKLYGSLDQNTLEWTDGVFTKILRKLSDTTADRNTHKSRSWIVFDGDVDPEWAENLNSVLDDNKVLTLPTGDRLKIPNFVKIMIEVDSLKNATLATVSRCGMIWFADSTVNVDSILSNHIKTFRKENIIVDSISSSASSIKLQKQTKDKFVDILSSIYSSNPNIVNIALTHTLNQVHIMEPSISSLLSTLYLIVLRGINLAIEYNEINSDFMISDSNLASFVNKWLLYSILWAFGGSMTNDKREVLGKLLFEHSNIDLPSNNKKLIDVFVNINDNSSWIEWNTMVPKMEIESHRVISSDVVITTIDTVRHVEVLKAWLSSHKPLILCGPPGSGKTMTLTSVLESMPEYILASLNFSSGTTPDLILKTFDQFCEIVDSPDGLVLQPNKQIYRESQWLVIFCDEINLPELDAYGTQRVIMFLRQLTEQRGYWNSDCKWITLKRIQFVGACNPPTDAGRTPLPMRFLRHAPILLVDYPAETSLKQIYRCFDHGLLKLHPNLKSFVDPLTNAMVEFYLLNQSHFSVDMAPQYIYSPRELSRWVRGMYEAMEPLEAMTSEELVRLWAHEALRLFHDRLITDQEREWCNNQMDIVASNHFGAFVDINSALQRPILYSNWLTKNYQSTKREHLKEYLMARLKVFYEEELDVPLVIFDDVIEHVLRIDNVLRHPMGHMLLAGESGVGKTVLSRFVSWINGLSVFQIKADSRYNIDQFDEDLRNLLRRVGIENEKICFIFDEGNALSTAFLERMNSLLASGEVPGLFEGDDRVQLLAACRENILSKNNSSVIIDSEDELWRNFTKLVQRNLHVIFTMNPASSDFDNRCMTSPALFNRCVVDWFGTWSQEALIQVGYEFTANIDTGYTDYSMSKEHVNKNMKTLDTLALTLEILKIEYPTLREAIVAALVNMHNVVKKLSIKTSKSGSRSIYISPRDYLDLINKFIKTENEKRSHLEEQQTHIRTGLQKIIETKDKVQDLRVDMVTKEKVLIQKDEQANLKLNSMVSKQNEAEIKKALAEKLTIELKNQNEEITIRKEIVEKELSEAEPALLSAKQSVQNIRKAHLDEVRALGRPPPLVKLTLEMVCIMIGEKNTDWNEIRKIIRREDFISTVVNFDPNSLTPKQVKQVSDEYLSNTELDYNSVDRASKACGPLFLWGESQIKYATILRKVKPLRDEVSNLQEQSIDLEKKQQEAVDQVNLLEADIIQYKNDYATAIRETEIIRNEMNLVKKKVTRAEDLLNSLSQENNRWEITSDTFNKEMSTLIGDCLISAGFLTYLGNFDHKARKYLLTDFYDVLDNLSIPYRTDLDIINFLSTLSDQMKWKSYGLLSDELTIQNAILLSRFQRYPLIIDPPGQALNFILNKYANEKIVKTSFLDSSFTKTLASAIRFGTPLLVQDVETVDPILNPVLNKEIQRTGGRVLIRLGNEDIDFSPKFMIILLTRNPLAKFPPDLCSRVSIINFTITPASLESQVLSAILKSERPDVDTKKNEILLLQSQQSIKIRELEEVLLNKISAVQGGILDDDSVIQNLEVIKAESTQLNTEVEKTEGVMNELLRISQIYNPLAVIMTNIYFTIEKLNEISFLYQFNLQFYLNIISYILTLKSNQNSSNSTNRINDLCQSLYNEVIRRVIVTLKYEDKILFIIRLGQISTANDNNKQLSDIEVDYLLRGSGPILSESIYQNNFKKLKDIYSNVISDNVAKQLIIISLISTFKNIIISLIENKDVWFDILKGKTNDPFNDIPNDCINEDNITDERLILLKLIVIKIILPQYIIVGIEKYISIVFNNQINWREYCKINLPLIVQRDSCNNIPILLCSEIGQDASSKVDDLARSMNKALLQIAMGSSEGYKDAEKLLAQGMKSGTWVLLRNIHLCSSEWLYTLEKKLYNISLSSDNNFRLFLSCEINNKLPTELLRLSEILLYETSTGIKANIQRFYTNLSSQRVDKLPTERNRLYSLMIWLHSVLQERLRYIPIGWTKKYEFTETDAMFALDIIDQWVDNSAGNRAHINPEDLPWDAIKTLLSQSVYGGRIDHDHDQIILDIFINKIFHPRNYLTNAALASDINGETLLTLPDGLNRQAFETWMKDLPDTNLPTLVGLPTTAETQLRIISGQRVLSKLTVLQGLDEETVDISSSSNLTIVSNVLKDNINKWQYSLPTTKTLNVLTYDLSSLDNLSTAFERCLYREIVKGKSILALILNELTLLNSYLNGETKLSNLIRDIIDRLNKGKVPKSWFSEYTVNKDINISQWIDDFVKRIKNLEKYLPIISITNNLSQSIASGVYWLGGMFSPEAFITATRQAAAQINKWNLEELELVLIIDDNSKDLSGGILVEGLILEGAVYSNSSKSINISDDLRNLLPISKLRWEQRNHLSSNTVISFPMYLNETRNILIADVKIHFPTAIDSTIWAQRGVALTIQSSIL